MSWGSLRNPRRVDVSSRLSAVQSERANVCVWVSSLTLSAVMSRFVPTGFAIAHPSASVFVYLSAIHQQTEILCNYSFQKHESLMRETTKEACREFHPTSGWIPTITDVLGNPEQQKPEWPFVWHKITFQDRNSFTKYSVTTWMQQRADLQEQIQVLFFTERPLWWRWSEDENARSPSTLALIS